MLLLIKIWRTRILETSLGNSAEALLGLNQLQAALLLTTALQ